MHRRILCILVLFLPCISHRFYSAAMSVLVAGGVVEFARGYFAKAGEDMLFCGLALLKYLMKEQQVMERLCAPEIVDQLLTWIAQWLQKVGALVV
jgi:hypothetical protein